MMHLISPGIDRRRHSKRISHTPPQSVRTQASVVRECSAFRK